MVGLLSIDGRKHLSRGNQADPFRHAPRPKNATFLFSRKEKHADFPGKERERCSFERERLVDTGQQLNESRPNSDVEEREARRETDKGDGGRRRKLPS